MEGMGEVRTECVVSGFNRGVHRTESSSFVHITESQAQKVQSICTLQSKKTHRANLHLLIVSTIYVTREACVLPGKKRSLARMQTQIFDRRSTSYTRALEVGTNGYRATTRGQTRSTIPQ